MPRVRVAAPVRRLRSRSAASTSSRNSIVRVKRPATSLPRLVGRGAEAATRYGLDFLKSKIATITGSGDYTIGDTPSYNVLSNRDQAPAFSTKGKTVNVCHREFVTTVYSSTTASSFQVQTFALTPTNSSLFPWLSQMAGLYKRFRFHGVTVEFRTQCGIAVSGTNSQVGLVISGWTSDPVAQIAGLRRSQIEQQENVVTVPPYRSSVMGVECARSTQSRDWFETAPLIIKNNLTLGGSIVNRNPFDTIFGQIFLASDGIPVANQQLGELWVSYCIEFEEASDLIETTPQYAAGCGSNPSSVILTSATSLPLGLNPVFTDTSGGTNLVNGQLFFGPGFSPGSIVRVEYIAQFSSTLSGSFNNGFAAFTRCQQISDATGTTQNTANDIEVVNQPASTAYEFTIWYSSAVVQITDFEAHLTIFNTAGGAVGFSAFVTSANIRVTLLNSTSYLAAS